MVESYTNGFDALMQLSEVAVNNQIGTIQHKLPESLTMEDRFENLNIKFDIHFDKPEIRFSSLRTHGNDIIIYMSFSNSTLTFSAGTFSRTLSSLEGVISVATGFRFVKDGDKRTLKIDFQDPPPDRILLNLSESSKNKIEQLILQVRKTPGNQFGSLSLEDFLASLEGAVSLKSSRYLSKDVREIIIPPEFKVESNTTNSAIIKDIDFKLAYDLQREKGALSYFVTYGTSLPGDVQSFNTYLIVPYKYDAAAVVSNQYLLEKKVIPQIKDGLGTSVEFERVASSRYLNRDPIIKDSLKIEHLRVSVENGFILIRISAVDNNISGVDAVVRDEIRISFVLGFDFESLKQVIQPKAVHEPGELTIDLKWWVYLLGFLTLGTLGGAAVITADQLAEYFGKRRRDDVIQPILKDIEENPIDLSVPGGGSAFLFDSISLDDLVLLGWPLSSYSLVRILEAKGISRPVNLRSLGSKHGLVPPFRVSELVKRLV